MNSCWVGSASGSSGLSGQGQSRLSLCTESHKSLLLLPSGAHPGLPPPPSRGRWAICCSQRPSSQEAVGAVADELGRGHRGERFKGEGRAEPNSVHRSCSSSPPTLTSIQLPCPALPRLQWLWTRSGWGCGSAGGRPGPPRPRAAAVPDQKGVEEP